MGELYRRYVTEDPRRSFACALKDLRTEAAEAPAKLTLEEIDRDLAELRRRHALNGHNPPQPSAPSAGPAALDGAGAGE